MRSVSHDESFFTKIFIYDFINTPLFFFECVVYYI